MENISYLEQNLSAMQVDRPNHDARDRVLAPQPCGRSQFPPAAAAVALVLAEAQEPQVLLGLGNFEVAPDHDAEP